MSKSQAVNGVIRKIPAWPIYIGFALWAAWMFYRGITGSLGVEPVERLEQTYGDMALKLVILGLAVTPFRKWTKINLLKFRRAIGVTTFFLVLAHFMVWAVLDVQSLSRVWADIVERWHITVGIFAMLLMLPLVVTSNDFSLRKIGGMGWRKLHKLTYPAAILAGLHWVVLVKGFQIEPLVYMAIIVALLATRIKWRPRKAA